MRRFLLSTLLSLLVFVSVSFNYDEVGECFAYLDAGDYQRAIRVGERIVRKYESQQIRDIIYGLANIYANIKAAQNPAYYYYYSGLSNELSKEYNSRERIDLEDFKEAVYCLKMSYYRAGLAAKNNRDFDLALYYYNKLLDFSKKYGDKEEQASILNGIAGIYYEKRGYEKAIDCLQQSLKLIKDDKKKASIYDNMAYIYFEREDYDRAVEYLQKSIELGEKAGDYHEVAKRYLYLGNTYRKLRNYELAKIYLTEGLSRIQKVGDEHEKAHGYAYLGALYRDKGDKMLAVEYFTKAYNLLKNLNAHAEVKKVEEELVNLGVKPENP